MSKLAQRKHGGEQEPQGRVGDHREGRGTTGQGGGPQGRVEDHRAGWGTTGQGGGLQGRVEDHKAGWGQKARWEDHITKDTSQVWRCMSVS